MDNELKPPVSAGPLRASRHGVFERVFGAFAPLPLRIEVELAGWPRAEENVAVRAPERLGPPAERLS